MIELLVQQFPDAAKERNNDGGFPLHIGKTFEVIQLLVQQHTEAVKKLDKYGWLPLHLACENNQTFEVIPLLVQQFPDAVKKTNMMAISLCILHA